MLGSIILFVTMSEVESWWILETLIKVNLQIIFNFRNSYMMTFSKSEILRYTYNLNNDFR